MNNTHHFRISWLPLLAVFGLISHSCSDDVYDPTKKRDIAPAENPFGADFTAPSGFDWSMLSTVSLQVEVQDIYNGSYEYLIEVFTSSPHANPAPAPIAAGYANSDHLYTTTLSVPAGTDRLFIRKTSPRQAKEIYEYAVQPNMVCKLYRQQTGTRLPASTHHFRSQAKMPRPTVSAPQIPEDATEWKIKNDWAAQWNAGNYILTDSIGSETFNVQVGSGVNLYVNSAVSLAGLTLQGGSSLTILAGGSLTLGGQLNAQSGSNVGNYGTLDVAHTNISTSSLLLNQGAISVSGRMGLTSCTVDNYGTIQAQGSSNESIQTNSTTDVVINNFAGATIQATAISNGCTLNNEGRIEANEISGWGPMAINNQSTGILQTERLGGNPLQLFNDGAMRVDELDTHGSNASITNQCTLIITDELKCSGTLTLNNGSLVGGWTGQRWLPISKLELNNGTSVSMNSSYILAEHIVCGSGVTIQATGAASMIQTEDIRYEWTTQLSGPLYLDCNEELNVGKEYAWRYSKDDQVVTSIPMNSARAYIETCSGVMYDRQEAPETGGDGGNTGGNTGGDGGNTGGFEPDPDPEPAPEPEPDPAPSVPPMPEEVTPVSSCTYAFEDNWPLYGDYDFNDIVLTIDAIKLTTRKSGQLKEAKIEGTLKAVGASRVLGIGIRFLGLDNSFTYNDFQCNWTTGNTTWEEGNDHPTLILTEDAFAQVAGSGNKRAFLNTERDGYKRQYKGFDLRIKFPNGDISPEAFDLSQLDVFIFCRTKAYTPYRREIHLAGYRPTNWADRSYEGTGNDNGYRNYTSNEGLSWGICVPSKDWRWPLEYYNIINESVYPQFESWVKSGSSMNSTWYYDYDSSKVY